MEQGRVPSPTILCYSVRTKAFYSDILIFLQTFFTVFVTELQKWKIRIHFFKYYPDKYPPPPPPPPPRQSMDIAIPMRSSFYVLPIFFLFFLRTEQRMDTFRMKRKNKLSLLVGNAS